MTSNQFCKSCLFISALILSFTLSSCSDGWSEKEHELMYSIEQAQVVLDDAQKRLDEAMKLLEQTYYSDDYETCKANSDRAFSLVEEAGIDIYSANDELNRGYYFQ